jgi:hypothetical protein
MVAATIVAVACQDVLSVNNPNNPNVAQVLATATDIEAVFAQGYLQVGFTGSGIHTNNIAPQLNAMSLENYGNVANFDMVYRAAIPRKFIDNSVNNSGAGVHFADFQNMQKLARTRSRHWTRSWAATTHWAPHRRMRALARGASWNSVWPSATPHWFTIRRQSSIPRRRRPVPPSP